MTDEEKQAFEAEKAQIAADYEAKIKEAEEKASKEKENLNKALHEARSKKPTEEEKRTEKKEDAPAFDMGKVEEVGRTTAAQVAHGKEIETLIALAGSDDDERKLIKAHFDRLKGNETDITKLRGVIEDAKILANKDSLLKRNPSWSVGSVAGGRSVEAPAEDDSSAKSLGRQFGLADEDYGIVNKPIIKPKF